MTDPTPSEMRARDPLSEVTRNERRSLLAIGTLGVVLVQTGMVPEKIDALGIEFSVADQRAILSIVALGTAYFLLAFVIYAASDFIAWRLAYRESIRRYIVQRDRPEPNASDINAEAIKLLGPVDRRIPPLTRPVSFLRAVFEFVLPILFGIYVTIMLLTTPVQSITAPPSLIQSTSTPSPTIQIAPTP